MDSNPPEHESGTDGSIDAGDIHGEGIAIGHQARAEVHKTTHYHLEADTTPPEPKFLVPFLRNAHFVGRSDDLEHLHALLQRGDAVGVRPAMLSGMGGIGKTQLAVEYAYRYQDAYPSGVYWVNAAQDWPTELASLAERAGARVFAPSESTRRRQLVQVFVDFLNGHPDALLIFDNVEDPRQLRSDVSGFVPAALQCRLLFTTRRRDPHLPFDSIEVKVLPEGAALELLLHTDARKGLLYRLKMGTTGPELEAARAICRSLGYLPLALALAAAYLGKYPKVSLSGYLQRLEREGGLATVDAAGVDRLDLPTRHDAAVAATLGSQWEALESAEAQYVLQTAALLGEAAQVPRPRLALLTGLAEEAGEGYPAPLEEALVALRDFSLVEELTEDEIRLHPLVRSFAEGTIPDRRTHAQACATRLAGALWEVARLQAEVAGRGVNAVLADLRAGCRLSAVAGNGAETQTRLSGLERALDREAHHLRDWDADQEPSLFLQQLRNCCFELGLDALQARTEAQLAEWRLPYLRERFPVGIESEALVRTLVGHTSPVFDVAVTPDGRYVVSTSEGETLKVWDLASGEATRTLRGHTFMLSGVAVTPDGRYVVSASGDRTLKVWDLASGVAVRTLAGHTMPVTGMAVTPDGRHIVSASHDQTLKVWDLASGVAVRTLAGHTDWVFGVAVTLDGRHIVSASHDQTLKVWDLASGEVVRTLAGHTAEVLGMAVTPDGRYAVSASDDQTLKVWDLASGVAVRTLAGHTKSVTGVAVTPDGRHIVSSSGDGTLKIWDLASGRVRLSLMAGTLPGALAITPDGQTVIAGGMAGDMHFLEWVQ